MGFLEAKLRAARKRARPKRRADPERRVPPGQRVVAHFPVLDLGWRPLIRTNDWRLEIGGEVDRRCTLDWTELRALGAVERELDVHCVTGWSRLGLRWTGVPVRDVLAAGRGAATAAHLTAHGADGYTANLPLDVLMGDDALVTWTVDGRPLSREHGGPVRLVVASRYFWKSVKWLVALTLHVEDRPGFWEQRGYHNRGDPWREERYG